MSSSPPKLAAKAIHRLSGENRGSDNSLALRNMVARPVETSNNQSSSDCPRFLVSAIHRPSFDQSCGSPAISVPNRIGLNRPLSMLDRITPSLQDSKTISFPDGANIPNPVRPSMGIIGFFKSSSERLQIELLDGSILFSRIGADDGKVRGDV